VPETSSTAFSELIESDELDNEVLSPMVKTRG
jgi:hypothetical protein